MEKMKRAGPSLGIPKKLNRVLNLYSTLMRMACKSLDSTCVGTTRDMTKMPELQTSAVMLQHRYIRSEHTEQQIH